MRHEKSIAFLGAVSTTTATIVALYASYQARYAGRPKLAARVAVVQIIYAGSGRPKKVPTYVAVYLTNTGTVPVRIGSNFFSWRLRFERNSWLNMLIHEAGDEHHAPLRFPVDLQPNTRLTVTISSIEAFRENMSKVLDHGRFGRRHSAKLLRAVIYTDGGSSFFATLAPDLRKEVDLLAASVTGAET